MMNKQIIRHGVLSPMFRAHDGTKRTWHHAQQCLLLGVKRTSVAPSSMSASDPKRTSGGALAKCRSCCGSLSVNAQMVVPKRPGRFYGVRCQFLVPILCFVWVCSFKCSRGVQHVSLRVSGCRSDS